ncbi:MAG: hypothetical protein GX457_16905 [Thermotogaceae bacterium]|nr:hypothetical protein [Thermotogaceae bacterium]
MGYKTISVGADRFLALQWVNYAYELFISSLDQDSSRKALREYLENQMLGQVSTRKTTDQLFRLWLYSGDPYQTLREMTLSIAKPIDLAQMAVFHLGMAINVFPIYRETVRVIGTLERLTDQISTKAISTRVIEKFPTTTSIPRTVNRVLQTLDDWHFIELTQGLVVVKEILLLDPKLVNWFILTTLRAIQQNEITLQELDTCPFKLGINFSHPRNVVNDSEDLFFGRNQMGLEVIRIKTPHS